MIILISKIIENGLKKDPEFKIETYLEDIFETDTNNLVFKTNDIFFDTSKNFIFGMDNITLTWIKETININEYFDIYNKLNTFEKLSFINTNISSVLYNYETNFLNFIIENELDYTIRKAIIQEIRKMEPNNEGIIEEFKLYLEKLDDPNYKQ